MAELLDLSVDLGRGLRLRSPVMVASGTFGYGFDAPLVDRTALGAIVTKGLRPDIKIAVAIGRVRKPLAVGRPCRVRVEASAGRQLP